MYIKVQDIPPFGAYVYKILFLLENIFYKQLSSPTWLIHEYIEKRIWFPFLSLACDCHRHHCRFIYSTINQ